MEKDFAEFMNLLSYATDDINSTVAITVTKDEVTVELKEEYASLLWLYGFRELEKCHGRTWTDDEGTYVFFRKGSEFDEKLYRMVYGVRDLLRLAD